MDMDVILEILLKSYSKSKSLNSLGSKSTIYSLDIETLEFLREGGCTTYIACGRNGKYLVKVIGSAFMDTIGNSIDIMLYLRQHNFPVPKIYLTNEDKPYVCFNYNDTDYILVLYELIEGKEPDIDDKAEEIGELTGKLHMLMQGYLGKLISRDKHFFIERYISILKQKGYPDKELEQYIKLGDILWKTVEGLPYGYSHGDLHRGNLLQTPDDKLYILDFDTSCIAPRMFDIMVMCDTTNYFDFNPKDFEYTTSIYKRFLSGYSKHISISEDEINSFYNFISIRHYQLQATIVEIFGLDCIDKEFIDKQLNWLLNWRKAYTHHSDI